MPRHLIVLNSGFHCADDFIGHPSVGIESPLTRGIGIRADEALTPGVQLGIAVHEPEASFHGRAVVRHCTDTGQGYHIVGLEFLFG